MTLSLGLGRSWEARRAAAHRRGPAGEREYGEAGNLARSSFVPETARRTNSDSIESDPGVQVGTIF